MIHSEASLPEIAPTGTIIRCAICDTPIAKLTKPIPRYGLMASDSIALLTGQAAKTGDAVLCPTNPSHRGSYEIVNGERWNQT